MGKELSLLGVFLLLLLCFAWAEENSQSLKEDDAFKWVKHADFKGRCVGRTLSLCIEACRNNEALDGKCRILSCYCKILNEDKPKKGGQKKPKADKNKKKPKGVGHGGN